MFDIIHYKIIKVSLLVYLGIIAILRLEAKILRKSFIFHPRIPPYTLIFILNKKNMTIRTDQGINYEPTEEGKRVLKTIIIGIILLFFISGSIAAYINSPISALIQSLPVFAIVGSIIYLTKNSKRFFTKVELSTRRIDPSGSKFADAQQNHLNQRADLPRNEPISIDGSSQTDPLKVKAKVHFILAYLLTVIGILAIFAYKINIFLEDEGMDNQDVIDAFNEAMGTDGPPIIFVILFMIGIFLTSAVFPSFIVFFVLNMIFGGSQMIQSLSSPQKTKVHRTGMRQQMMKNQGVNTSSSGQKQIINNETLFSSSQRQSSKSQDYCKKCYGALNPVGKCPQCN